MDHVIGDYTDRAPKAVERLNQETRRRERVIRIFPNEETAMRLIGAVLMEIDEVWTTGHCYFDMEEYWEWKAGTGRAKTATVVLRRLRIEHHHLPEDIFIPKSGLDLT